MAIFTGAGVAVITPFHQDGTINFESFGRIIDHQIEHGTDSIIVCGTTGESSTMTHAEHMECVSFVAAHVKKRVPVIAGTGSNCTAEAVSLSVEAQKAGADALLVVSPYYNKTTQKGLISHFTEIAAAVDIPMMLYNIQGRTGLNIMPETICYLVRNVENIVAVKEASGNISQVAKIMQLCEGQIDLYSGNDDQIVPLLSLGGKGVVSVLSNVIPQETHDIVSKYLAGDTKASLELQLKYLPLIDALFSEVNPIPVKKAMNLLGFEAGSLRKPLLDMEEPHAAVLEAEMRKLGLIA